MANILLIEDDDDLRLTISRLFRLHGHTVFDASDGEKGSLLYKNTFIDLVITDIFMPEKEGLATILELKQRDPDVKVIAISGGGRDGNIQYLEIAKVFGADRTFEKPVDSHVLLEAISQLLETPA